MTSLQHVVTVKAKLSIDDRSSGGKIGLVMVLWWRLELF